MIYPLFYFPTKAIDVISSFEDLQGFKADSQAAVWCGRIRGVLQQQNCLAELTSLWGRS